MKKRVSDEEMKLRVELSRTDPDSMAKWEGEARGKVTLKGYKRDYEALLGWTSTTCVAELTEKDFLAAMEGYIGAYSKSRLENFRSAVAFRQKLDLREEDCWTENRGFRIRFNGVLKKAEVEYRAGIKSGKFAQTKRGPLTEDKLLDLVNYCASKGEVDYAGGFVVSYHVLLRHKDVMKLTGDCITFTEGAGWRVKIVEGKGRPAGHVEWVSGEDCPNTLKKLAQLGRGAELLFPNWKEQRANDIIKEAAAHCKWEYKGIPHAVWVHHGCRIGKATDLYEKGMDIFDLMERGRWESKQMALHYAVH